MYRVENKTCFPIFKGKRCILKYSLLCRYKKYITPCLIIVFPERLQFFRFGMQLIHNGLFHFVKILSHPCIKSCRYFIMVFKNQVSSYFLHFLCLKKSQTNQAPNRLLLHFHLHLLFLVDCDGQVVLAIKLCL